LGYQADIKNSNILNSKFQPKKGKSKKRNSKFQPKENKFQYFKFQIPKHKSGK